jgi:hypothetical protein
MHDVLKPRIKKNSNHSKDKLASEPEEIHIVSKE